ncbi:MAG: TIM barrel protein [bacterium]
MRAKKPRTEQLATGIVLFGTGGTPRSSPSTGSVDGVRRIRELGLDCMELEFVQGVKMGEETAAVVRQAAEEANVKLTCHAPYFINLSSTEPKKVEDSVKRIYDSARIGALCGADGVVFHPGFYMGRTSEQVYPIIRKGIEKVLTMMKKEKIKGVWLRPELTGKGSQFGDIDELLRLSRDLENVLPCVDFSHLHARSGGKCNTYAEFAEVIEKIGNTLGDAALQNMHIHLSGIEYSDKGERQHLLVDESDMNYGDVLKVLVDYKISGKVVCESPNLEGDALIFQREYLRLKE